MDDRESFIETGDGGAAAIVAGLLVVALIVVGFFYLSSMNGGWRAIDIDVPRVAVDVTPIRQ